MKIKFFIFFVNFVVKIYPLWETGCTFRKAINETDMES